MRSTGGDIRALRQRSCQRELRRSGKHDSGTGNKMRGVPRPSRYVGTHWPAPVTLRWWVAADGRSPWPTGSANEETMNERYDDVTVTLGGDRVATVEIHRPPDNFFDVDLIRSLAETYAALDAEGGCRAIVLCSEGKHFCAGADFTGSSRAASLPSGANGAGRLYQEAARLFEAKIPVVAAVQGAAIGGGLGLAC